MSVATDGLKIKIIDTIGMGCTNLMEEEVLVKLARLMYHIQNGVHQVLFCSGGRFAYEEVDAFKMLVSVLLSPEVMQYTSIVRTRFRKFDCLEKTAEDLNSAKNENAENMWIFSNVRKVVWVDNNPDVEDKVKGK